MKNLTSLENLTSLPALRTGSPKRVAAVCAADAHSQQALSLALDEGLVEVVFVGRTDSVRENEGLMRHASHIRLIEASTDEDAARQAVSLVRQGEADVLMKGLISSDTLLHAVLDKESGILPRGTVLTHIAACQLPGYDRPVFFSDSAVIPYPTQEQREAQVRYMAALLRKLGIAEPRIALIHCSEKVNARIFPHTEGYINICTRARAGEYGPCIVDGPLDLKTSLDPESLRTKGIDSPIEGRADALVFPDIEAANTFYKAVTLLLHAPTAAFLQGPAAPVVLTSRADALISKYYSLLLACGASADPRQPQQP